MSLAPTPHIISSWINDDTLDWPHAIAELIDNAFGEAAGATNTARPLVTGVEEVAHMTNEKIQRMVPCTPLAAARRQQTQRVKLEAKRRERERMVKKAYRCAGGNPWIQALLMPPGSNTKVRRIAQKFATSTLGLLERLAEIDALVSNGMTPDAAIRQIDQRQKKRDTTAASRVRRRHGNLVRKQVRALTRKNMDQLAIAKTLGISTRQVSRHQRQE